MWTVLYDVFNCVFSWWLIFYFMTPQSQFPPSSQFEVVGPIAMLHVFSLAASLPCLVVCYLFGFSFLGRFLLWFSSGLIVFLICNHIEISRLRAQYQKIPGVHTAKEGAHWFWGDMLNMKNNIRTFSTEYNSDQHRKFGGVIAISPPWFSKVGQVKVTDPLDVQFILKDNFNNFIKPPFFKELFGELLGEGIFISQHAHTPDNGKNWKLQRKIASNIFTSRNFRENFYNIFVSKAHQVCGVLAKVAEQNDNTLDWQKLCSAFTLESIGEIGFGISLNCLDFQEGRNGQALPFATAFDRAQALCMGRLGRPGVLRRLAWFLKPEQELRQCVKTMDEFTSKVIRDRRKQILEGKTDLLSLFMAYRSDGTSEEAPSEFSDKFLKDVVMSFFIAGRDTTASTLTFTFWLLSQNPEVQSELLREIDSVCPKGSTPTYEMVKGSTSLPYLDGVIKEVLRLFPPVPVDPKYAVEGCTLPSGYYVPPRCIVFYQPYVMGRSPELYPDPLVMDPLRWVGQPEPSHYRFPVFQAGKRICLGMSMALMEAKLLAIMVLQSFTLRVTSPKPNENIDFSLALTLSVEGGLHVEAQPRA